MKVEEAIRILKMAELEWSPLEYRDAFDVAIEALEKQIPKKFNMVDDYIPVCPVCGEEIWDMVYLNVWKHEDGKCVWTDTYTTSDLRPYTASESYIDGLSKGRKEAWEFAMKCLSMDGSEFCDVFDSCDALCLTNYSYQEAKAKVWKAKKAEIRVGDEVKITEGGSLCVVCGIVGRTANLIFEKGDLGQFPVDKLIRTGRHFDSVEKLLEEMRSES